MRLFHLIAGMNKSEFFKLVGNRFRELRIKQGFTAYDSFAFSKELPRQTVLRAEQGKGITLETLYNLISALEVSPEEFFKGIK
jgi:transcriptional regulator with XRE-family HTH domain